MTLLRHGIECSAECDGFPEQTLALVRPRGMEGIDAELEIPKEMGEAELMATMSDDHEMSTQPVAHPDGSGVERSQESFDDVVAPGTIDVEEVAKGLRKTQSCARLPAIRVPVSSLSITAAFLSSSLIS